MINNKYFTEEQFNKLAKDFWLGENPDTYINYEGIEMAIREHNITADNVAEYSTWGDFNQARVSDMDFNEWLSNSLFDDVDIKMTCGKYYYPIFYSQGINDTLREAYEDLKEEFNHIGNEHFDTNCKSETQAIIKQTYFNN